MPLPSLLYLLQIRIVARPATHLDHVVPLAVDLDPDDVGGKVVVGAAVRAVGKQIAAYTIDVGRHLKLLKTGDLGRGKAASNDDLDVTTPLTSPVQVGRRQVPMQISAINSPAQIKDQPDLRKSLPLYLDSECDEYIAGRRNRFPHMLGNALKKRKSHRRADVSVSKKCR